MSEHLESILKLLQNSEGLSADEVKATKIAIKKVEEELQMQTRSIEEYLQDARLEISLEKVRSKTMIMRDSHDVAKTVVILFEEMVKLGVKTIRSGIGIMKEGMRMEIWTSNIEAKENAELIAGYFDMTKHAMFRGAHHSWENKEGMFSYVLKGDDLVEYYTAVNNMPDYKTKYNLATLPKILFHNSFHFNEGTLFVFSLEELPLATLDTCKRFANVFGQTYRRFLDLREVEEQKDKLEEKQKEILDSINYARRIQTSLLPTELFINRVLNEKGNR